MIEYTVTVTDAERNRRMATLLRKLATVPVSPSGAEIRHSSKPVGGPVPPRPRMVVGNHPPATLLDRGAGIVPPPMTENAATWDHAGDRAITRS